MLAGFDGAATAAVPSQPESDAAVATQSGENFFIQNRAIAARWSVRDGKATGLTITDRIHSTELPVAAPFAILLKDGTIYSAGNLQFASQPTKRELIPQPGASRLADRLHGIAFDFPFESSDHSLRVTWSLVLLDGSS